MIRLHIFVGAFIILYSDQEGTCSVHLVLSWPRYINLWERDNVMDTRSLCRGLASLS